MSDTEVRRLFESALESPPLDRIDIDEAVRAGSRRRRKRQLTASMASAAVVVMVVVAVFATGAVSGAKGPQPSTSGPPHPPSPTVANDPGEVVRATAENRRLAEAASGAALKSLPLPVGAVRLPGKPAGWPDAGMSLGPSDKRLTDEAWWAVPTSRTEVARFLTDHTPRGMRHPVGEDVVGEGPAGIASVEYDMVTSPDPSAFTGPSLLVQFLQIGDRTVLRADTFLAARFAVSQEHRIGDDVVAVQIERVGRKGGTDAATNVPLPTVRLTAAADADAIARLVTTFNSLYGSQDVVAGWSCPFPGNPPAGTTVIFFTRTSGGESGKVVAELNPGCFGQIRVTVNGVELQTTLDPVHGTDSWPPVVDNVADAAN